MVLVAVAVQVDRKAGIGALDCVRGTEDFCEFPKNVSGTDVVTAVCF